LDTRLLEAQLCSHESDVETVTTFSLCNTDLVRHFVPVMNPSLGKEQEPVTVYRCRHAGAQAR
uniref:BURP domain-containing protein n=1 Tax=Ascaris lumbricoides TaxID=6252 RepID=A0A0M3HN43_ASCLU